MNPRASLAAVVLAALAAPASSQQTDAFRVPLTYRGDRQWKIELPAETWSPVGPAFELAVAGKREFPVRLEGTKLLVDCDGDGTTDVKAEGKTAFVTLRGDGFAYALRLANTKGWHFAAGGYVTGKIKGTKIRIIDQNNNGRYGEVGKDAMVIGRGKIATFLSRVVSVGGRLYEIDVAADGSGIDCKPFGGAAGELSLDYRTQGKVLSAVVASADKTLFFDLAKTRKLSVPAGRYEVMSGQLGLGKGRVYVARGEAKPIDVAPGAVREMAWGGPVRADFAYERAGGKVHLAPDRVWYYGAAGEEYVGWNPLGESPRFTVTDKRSGTELAKAYFPGTC